MSSHFVYSREKQYMSERACESVRTSKYVCLFPTVMFAEGQTPDKALKVKMQQGQMVNCM